MSDTSQGPGWWQAADGKWYPPDQPPAPGWWRASDGNWYPPATDEAPAAIASVPAGGPDAAEVPAGGPGAAEVPAAPTPGGSHRTVFIVAAAVLIVALIGAGLIVTRNRSTSDSTVGAGSSGGPSAGPGGGDSGLPVVANDEQPAKDITLDPNVVVVKSNNGKVVKSLGTDGASLILDGSAEGVDQLAPGKILLLTGVTVVKVKAVDKTAEGVKVTGEPATLPDVIKNGTLDWKDVEVDPNAGQLLLLPEAGTGGSSGGEDSTTTEDPTAGAGDDINNILGGGDENGLGPVGLPMGEGESAAGAVRALPGKTVSGKAGAYGFDITYEPDGRGHHLTLTLKPTGDVNGTIKVDVKLHSMAHSGNIAMKDSKLQNFDFTMADLGGDAEITTQLQGLKNVASVNLPPFFKLPFSIEFPAFVGGIPFTLKIGGSVQVNMSLSLANDSLSGRAEIHYDGDAGFHWKGGSLKLDGQRTQESPDLLTTLQGVHQGPVGIVFTTELPKVSFGFGFLQTGAGIFLSSGMVSSQTLLPPPAQCTAMNVAYVLAAGVEASFLGKGIEIARKAIVDKRWTYQAPQDKRCNAAK